ncbi:MAG: hypothetical protein U0W24_00335 [Bacteroidales bacterium]
MKLILFKRPVGLTIMLLLLFAGNILAFLKIRQNPEAILRLFVNMNSKSLILLQVIQFLNIISIAGIWFLRKWGVWFALALTVVVLYLDFYYQIWHHIPVLLIAAALTSWAIGKNWKMFR